MYVCPIVLYKSVLIESAEQAEALPVGTVLLHLNSQGGVDQAGVVQRGYVEYSGVREEFPDDWAVGDLALVSIEAVEEWAVSHDRDAPAWSSVTRERAQNPGVAETAHVRYVTPWEEA